MRRTAPVFCFFLCACGTGGSVLKDEVQDAGGSNKLALLDRDVSSVFEVIKGERAYDFDSLLWRTNAGGDIWGNCVVLKKEDFQGNHPRRRWVSGIHSIDSTTGNAIIQVAEESPPAAIGGGFAYTVDYSWREWNLRTNGEVRFLRKCGSPYEKFEP